MKFQIIDKKTESSICLFIEMKITRFLLKKIEFYFKIYKVLFDSKNETLNTIYSFIEKS